MANDTETPTLTNRRALEALRNGVPNGDAVAALGCNQQAVEQDFNSMLSRITNDAAMPDSSLGMLVAGDFGSGKSHLLGYLETQALKQSFVCSKVVISKETPLFDMEKVFKAAVEHGRAQGITGHLVEEIVHKPDRDPESYAEFLDWAHREDNHLHRILPATLALHDESGDDDLKNDINRFWSGDTILVSKVKRGLQSIGQRQSYPFRAPVARNMPPQKLRFVLELIKAAGYFGWVILLDEIELVANYSRMQRARSYAELARWLGQAPDEKYPGLVVVGTIAADFSQEVLEQKEDRDKAAPYLRARGQEVAADRSEIGLRIINQGGHVLGEPKEELLFDLYRKLKQMHSQAYNWDAPDINREIGGGVRRAIRPFVRQWINEWDLRRLYPALEPDMEVTDLPTGNDEDTSYEKPPSEDLDPPGIRDEGGPDYESQLDGE